MADKGFTKMSLKEPTEEELKNLDKILLEANKRTPEQKTADFAKAYGAKMEQSILDKMTFDLGVSAEAFAKFSHSIGATTASLDKLREAMSRLPKIDFAAFEEEFFDATWRNAWGPDPTFDIEPSLSEREDFEYEKGFGFRYRAKFPGDYGVPFPKSFSAMYGDAGGCSSTIEVLILGTSNHGKRVRAYSDSLALDLDCEYEPDDINPTREASEEAPVPQMLHEIVTFKIDTQRRIAYPKDMPLDQVDLLYQEEMKRF